MPATIAVPFAFSADADAVFVLYAEPIDVMETATSVLWLIAATVALEVGAVVTVWFEVAVEATEVVMPEAVVEELLSPLLAELPSLMLW